MIIENPKISVIIPCYNAAAHIKNCLDILKQQDITEAFEVIIVDDASTDQGPAILGKQDFPGLQVFSLPKNSGPAAARNRGLDHAKGEYLFFLDVDDTMALNTLSKLYRIATETGLDLVLCDRKFLEGSKNIRENKFMYPSDKTFGPGDVSKAMSGRYFNPLDMSLFQTTGRLIRRSVIHDNNIRFVDDLRYLEDEAFEWDFLGFVNGAFYLQEQLYAYHLHPNVSTALSAGLDRGYPISNFKKVQQHIRDGLVNRGFSEDETFKISEQGLIYLIVSSLISYSRSMLLGKVDYASGKKCRRQMIDEILADEDVRSAVKNYTVSEIESPWIVRGTKWRLPMLMEYACTKRAEEIIKTRRKAA